jgi:hypothetical protein
VTTNKNNIFKRFFCWIGWHSIIAGWDESQNKDGTGFLTFAKCKWCGYEGQIDSQGNLF